VGDFARLDSEEHFFVIVIVVLAWLILIRRRRCSILNIFAYTRWPESVG